MEKEIWEGVMNDPIIATSPKMSMLRRVLLQTPGVEKAMVSISLEPPSASKPEGATSPQDLALVPRRQPPPPPGFSTQVLEDLTIPPIEDAYLLGAPTLFDLSTLELLGMTISHTQATDEVHYHLQAWSLARMTLPSTST